MIRAGGKHILAEFKTKDKKLINNWRKLEKHLEEVAIKNGFSDKTKIHRFTPYGLTIIAVLGESHIILHTYPEYNHLSFDCYTCFGNPRNVMRDITKKLKLELLQTKELLRGKDISELEQERDWMNGSLSQGLIIKYHIKKKLFSRKSKYQQIDIIENEYFGKMLFLDYDLQIAEKDAHIYNSSLVTPIVKQGSKIDKVLILGGGDGGVANELIKNDVKEVIVCDIDREVIEACKKFMPEIWGNALNSQKVDVVISNASKYLNKKNKFDAIIYDLTSHPNKPIKVSRENFLRKIFLNIQNNLKSDGFLSMQCSPEGDTETLKLVEKLLKTYFVQTTFLKSFIPSYCCNWIFAASRKK
ncbi:adenosylmethionine decarboxylase [Candidatus Pacearchaeota archaeon]|nr:adenosylmethionine decarboxylase [Candidatus Pacearchaeota archaeon]